MGNEDEADDMDKREDNEDTGDMRKLLTLRSWLYDVSSCFHN